MSNRTLLFLVRHTSEIRIGFMFHNSVGDGLKCGVLFIPDPSGDTDVLHTSTEYHSTTQGVLDEFKTLLLNAYNETCTQIRNVESKISRYLLGDEQSPESYIMNMPFSPAWIDDITDVKKYERPQT